MGYKRSNIRIFLNKNASGHRGYINLRMADSGT